MSNHHHVTGAETVEKAVDLQLEDGELLEADYLNSREDIAWHGIEGPYFCTCDEQFDTQDEAIEHLQTYADDE